MDNVELTKQVLALRESEGHFSAELQTINHRLDKQDDLIESLRSLTSSVGMLAEGQERIERSVKTVCKDVDELKAKPGKRWNDAVTVIITAVITAVVTMMLAHAGIM